MLNNEILKKNFLFPVKKLIRNIFWDTQEGSELQLKHVLAKVDKQHFSKNEFLVFFKLFDKNVLPKKKILFIFTYFLIINGLSFCTYQQS